jgi:hypothetical protein
MKPLRKTDLAILPEDSEAVHILRNKYIPGSTIG